MCRLRCRWPRRPQRRCAPTGGSATGIARCVMAHGGRLALAAWQLWPRADAGGRGLSAWWGFLHGGGFSQVPQKVCSSLLCSEAVAPLRAPGACQRCCVPARSSVPLPSPIALRRSACRPPPRSAAATSSGAAAAQRRAISAALRSRPPPARRQQLAFGRVSRCPVPVSRLALKSTNRRSISCHRRNSSLRRSISCRRRGISRHRRSIGGRRRSTSCRRRSRFSSSCRALRRQPGSRPKRALCNRHRPPGGPITQQAQAGLRLRRGSLVPRRPPPGADPLAIPGQEPVMAPVTSNCAAAAAAAAENATVPAPGTASATAAAALSAVAAAAVASAATASKSALLPVAADRHRRRRGAGGMPAPPAMSMFRVQLQLTMGAAPLLWWAARRFRPSPTRTSTSTIVCECGARLRADCSVS